MSREKKDGKIRIEKATTGTVYYKIWRRKVFGSRNLSRRSKVQVFQAGVMLVLLYGAETWSVTQQGIRTLERCANQRTAD